MPVHRNINSTISRLVGREFTVHTASNYSTAYQRLTVGGGIAPSGRLSGTVDWDSKRGPRIQLLGGQVLEDVTDLMAL